MRKDLDFGNDISQETATAVSSDTTSDTGGDLASDAGVDLNADEVSKAEWAAKATIMSYEVPPPPAIYTEAPEHTGKTPGQIVAEMAEAWDYAGPANEPEVIVEPSKPEYGDSPK
jgi:hypothetical protein